MQVDLQMSDESVYPSDAVLIDITSSPNSFVGVLAVDRSLSILKRVENFNEKIKDKIKSDVFFIIHPG